jgi:hypothetical protein
MEWNETFAGVAIWGSSIEDFGKCLIQTKDNGYVLVGRKDSQIWMAKLAPSTSTSASFSFGTALIIVVAIVVIVGVLIALLHKRRILSHWSDSDISSSLFRWLCFHAHCNMKDLCIRQETEGRFRLLFR